MDRTQELQRRLDEQGFGVQIEIIEERADGWLVYRSVDGQPIMDAMDAFVERGSIVLLDPQIPPRSFS